MTDTPHTDDNKLIAERRAKLDRLRTLGPAFPNDFRRDALADQLITAYGDRPPEWFDQHTVRVKVGGRMMAKRVMGKASFAKIMDRSGQIQLFVQSEPLGALYDEFKGGTSAICSAPKAFCSRPRPASYRSASKSCGCLPRRCARSPINGMDLPIRKFAIDSDTWI